jgi:hypothetical protein
MKILVVDGNELNRKSARLTLSNHDLTVCSTQDEAYALLEAGQYDVFLCGILETHHWELIDGAWGKEWVDRIYFPGMVLAKTALRTGVKYVAIVSDRYNRYNVPERCDQFRWNERISANEVIITNCSVNIGCKVIKDWAQILAPDLAQLLKD